MVIELGEDICCVRMSKMDSSVRWNDTLFDLPQLIFLINLLTDRSLGAEGGILRELAWESDFILTLEGEDDSRLSFIREIRCL